MDVLVRNINKGNSIGGQSFGCRSAHEWLNITGEFGGVFEHDELTFQMKEGNVLAGFTEGFLRGVGSGKANQDGECLPLTPSFPPTATGMMSAAVWFDIHGI